MARKLLFFILLAGLFSAWSSFVLAAEKLKLGTSIKLGANFYLPVLTAEERGFWKENGLEVEWVPFAGGTAHAHAVAAGAINMGHTTLPDTPVGAERGLPVIMVAEVVSSRPVLVLVRADSPFREVRDLKGKRIGVTGLGGTTHGLGRVVTAAHGVEKDVRFVGVGGEPQSVAAIKVGSVEAIVLSFSAGIPLKLDGTLREIASTSDYMPKPWFDQVLYSRKDFARSNPDTVRKVIKATLQAADFMRKNPRWTIDKIKSFQGASEEAAKLLYEGIKWTSTGKLDRKAVENVRKLFIEFGIMTEKAPPVDELFTNEYIPS